MVKFTPFEQLNSTRPPQAAYGSIPIPFCFSSDQERWKLVAATSISSVDEECVPEQRGHSAFRMAFGVEMASRLRGIPEMCAEYSAKSQQR